MNEFENKPLKYYISWKRKESGKYMVIIIIIIIIIIMIIIIYNN